MQDRPNAQELAQAVLEFLQNEIAPALQDKRLKFHTLVAMNGLGILVRELTHEDTLLRDELQRLGKLLGQAAPVSPMPEQLKHDVLALNRELARRIRQNQPPQGALQAVKQTIADKLRVASPRYLEKFVP